MSGYTAVTDADLESMLAAIGVSSVDEIFARQIPAALRLRRGLELPAGMPEQDVYAHLRELAERNLSVEDELSFLGAGMYDHYVPAIVDMLMERSEFLTPYTPYQPEVSQGGLQVMFEYQTAICELTALPVANASLYEGPSAVASAGYLARQHNGRRRFVVSAGMHPHSIETLRTYAHGFGAEVVEVGLREGRTDTDAWSAAIDADTSAAFFAQPNLYGAVEDARALASAVSGGSSDALSVVQVDPITLGILAAPGECGVDVAVGEGQPLGNRLDFGGPSFGFFAAREELLRRMPGRIAGETRDADGRRGFVLTLQTPRAAHPSRAGDLEHLHRPGLERARCDRVSELARAAGDRRARGAPASVAPTTPAARSPRSRASRPCTGSPSSASSPCASASTRANRRISRRCAGAASRKGSTRASTCRR